VSNIELVVFDVAGTTIQDRGEVLQAFRAALQSQGVGVTDESLQSWRGASKRTVLRFFIQQQYGEQDPCNAARVEQSYQDFCQHLEGAYLTNGVTLIDGVERTFAWLRERDVKIVLTTGFYRRVTDIILEAAGWGPNVVDGSVSSDEVSQGRPAPYMIFSAMVKTGVMDVRRVIKVGDTMRDLQAGMNAGVRGVVGVLSGSQDVDRLGTVAHTHLIASVAKLPDLMAREFLSDG
jgi:phosphonatase-like hydrolase